MSFWSFSYPVTPLTYGLPRHLCLPVSLWVCILRNHIGSYCVTLFGMSASSLGLSAVTVLRCRAVSTLLVASVDEVARIASHSCPDPSPRISFSFGICSELVLFADSGLSLRSYRARESSNSWSRRRDVWRAGEHDGPPNRGLGRQWSRPDTRERGE